jgi:hypothetical protein
LPAIDHQRLACDEAAIITRQKKKGRRHVLYSTGSVQRYESINKRFGEVGRIDFL